jgi:hypothetical protein
MSEAEFMGMLRWATTDKAPRRKDSNWTGWSDRVVNAQTLINALQNFDATRLVAQYRRQVNKRRRKAGA